MKRQTYKGFVIDTDQFGRVYIFDAGASVGDAPRKIIVSHDCKHCRLTDVKRKIDFERLSSGVRSDRTLLRGGDIKESTLVHYIADTFERPRDSDSAIHITAFCVEEALNVFNERFDHYTLIGFVVVDEY